MLSPFNTFYLSFSADHSTAVWSGGKGRTALPPLLRLSLPKAPPQCMVDRNGAGHRPESG